MNETSESSTYSPVHDKVIDLKMYRVAKKEKRAARALKARSKNLRNLHG